MSRRGTMLLWVVALGWGLVLPSWGDGFENLLNGESTLVFVPITDTLPYRTTMASLSWVNNRNVSTFPILGVLYSPAPNAEVGVGYGSADPQGPGTWNQWHLVGKYRFAEERGTQPALALEARYQDADWGKGWGVHLLGSLRLNRPEAGYLLRGHALLGWQRWTGNVSDLVPALGLQYLHPKGWEVALEYVFENDAMGGDSLAVGLRYAFRPQWDLHLGAGDDGRVFAGVRYFLAPP